MGCEGPLPRADQLLVYTQTAMASLSLYSIASHGVTWPQMCVTWRQMLKLTSTFLHHLPSHAASKAAAIDAARMVWD